MIRCGTLSYILKRVMVVCALWAMASTFAAAEPSSARTGRSTAKKKAVAAKAGAAAVADQKVSKNVTPQKDGAAPIGVKKADASKGAPAAKAQSDAKASKSASAADDGLGEPLAAGILDIVREEEETGFKKRGVQDAFARFQSYAGYKLNSTAGPYTGSELTGNCRLSWYDHLLRNPLRAPAEAEEFTRLLHAGVRNDPGGIAQILPIIAEKLDLPKRTVRKPLVVKTPAEALEVVKQALVGAQTAYVAALAPLTKGEIRELAQNIYPAFLGQNQVGHTLNDRGTARRLCDLMEKMDRGALLDAADALSPLTDPKVLEQLKKLPTNTQVNVAGVSGPVVAKIATPAGAIVIGGKGANEYDLDAMRDVAAVIDLGGDDVYNEGTASIDRPVLVVMDLAGNDTYRGSRSAIQGGAALGVSMLLDLEGDDTYTAHDLAQGVAIAGVGILIDYAGNDRYHGVRRLQGQALGGIGVLIDRGGNDDYHAGLWAQGVGGPLGFAMLDDLAGDDHYYCGGLYTNSYKPETPGYEGWGQGVGGGIRQAADGGIGVILDGAGDDEYEFDYLSHGGGYWCGLGFARDFAGNDKRVICRKAFDGSERRETLFQRFGCGWGCHYALGFCFDDRGDDFYQGTIMGQGMGWDCSVGTLCDFGGNDHYEANGGLTQGCGAQASLGLMFDYDGDDVYVGYGQGNAPSGISYHDLPGCGGNFAFLIDYGGNDKYGCGASNNCYIQRGAAGGFLIDRPRTDEVNTAENKPNTKTTANN